MIANHHNLLLGAPRARRTTNRIRPATARRAARHDQRGASMSTAVIPTSAGQELTSDQLELQQRARTFVETVLMPLEVEAEELRRPSRADETIEMIKREAIAARLNGGRFAAELRRPGLVDARVVPGQRAVRPGHERPALARAERLQRADAGHARADRALRVAGAARRGRRRVRGDRGRGRVGSERDRHHRGRPATAAGESTARSGS